MNKMTKDNILLIEKQSVNQNEFIDNKEKEGQKIKISGFKLFRVIKPVDNGFDIIAQYNHEDDHINISCLKDYIGYYLVSVDRDKYNNDIFVWNCVKLGKGSEDNEVFTISDNRECTKEEVKLLNEIFPEYYDHAF